VGFAACSIGCEEGVARSKWDGGWTGGGIRAPLSEDVSWSELVRLERAEVAVPGREDVVGCRVLEGRPFTGGAGATGSSAAGASIPSGPSGPMESSRLSSVVDWARLPYRRGARDFDGAGLEAVLDAGDEGSCVGSDVVC
jgi:hypothetical protein